MAGYDKALKWAPYGVDGALPLVVSSSCHESSFAYPVPAAQPRVWTLG